MRLFSLLLMLGLISFVPLSGLSNQTNTTFTGTTIFLSTQFSTFTIGETTFAQLTTSTYGLTTGTVPGSYLSDTGQQICYYLSYPFHVDVLAHRIVGSVSASSPVSFYLMSRGQYDDFVNKNPPCGSSYPALVLDYSRKSFTVDWSLDTGDYYILLENVSTNTVNYTVELSAIENASSPLYSTKQIIQPVTSNMLYASAVISQSASTIAQSSTNSYEIPIVIVVALILMLTLFIYHKNRLHRVAKDEGTRIY